MKAFLRTEYGLPGHDALSRLFRILDLDHFAAVLASFAPGIALGEVVVDRASNKFGRDANAVRVVGNGRRAIAI